MLRTFALKLRNGKLNDERETLYIVIQHTPESWCYMVDWETNAGCFSYTDSGGRYEYDQMDTWDNVIKDAIVNNIIGTQTSIDPSDVDDFLKSEEGSWLVSFTPKDFADENWKEWGN